MKEVAEWAKSPAWLAQARKRLRSKFFSGNTLASKNSKRAKVWELARVVAKSEGVIPLDVDTLEATAAALLETGMKAADQYLSELKAMHIEGGHWWSDKLNHHLSLCKRALSRGKGPEKRAKEFRVDRMCEAEFDKEVAASKSPRRPGWAFVWAACWMLRSVEAAEVLTSHVKLDKNEKTVRLFIPKSKMDQAEKGVYRTLGCCGCQPCAFACTWRIANLALKEVAQLKRNSEGALFPCCSGNKVSQFHLIKAWQENLDSELTGHSARRTGAMHYTRAGLSVPEISFLGRWKSSAVFRYVEEALQELPANWRASPVSKAPISHEAVEQTTVSRKRKRTQTEDEDAKKSTTGLAKETSPLWAISRGRTGKTAHVVAQAAWNLALQDWQTSCGWHFARLNTKVELTKIDPGKPFHCKKCSEINELRDGVKGGFSLAQLIEL